MPVSVCSYSVTEDESLIIESCKCFLHLIDSFYLMLVRSERSHRCVHILPVEETMFVVFEKDFLFHDGFLYPLSFFFSSTRNFCSSSFHDSWR